MRVRVVLLALGVSVVASVFGKEVLPAFVPDRPGAVKPGGWLLDWSMSAKRGFTGHLEGLDEHFRIAWTTNCMRRGEYLQWFDKKLGSWSAEGGAYWFEGLVKLAWQLDDPELKDLAKRRLDTLLDNVDEHSIGFLWWMDRRKPEEQDEAFKKGNWQFEIIGACERAVGAYAEAAGDARALRALNCAFDYPDMAKRFGWCYSFASGIFDAWRLTRSDGVASCLDVACGRIWDVQYTSSPWPRLADTLNLKRVHERQFKLQPRHGVVACEQLLSLLAVYQRTGNKKLLKAIEDWIAFFEENCEQPAGILMADEEWGWKGARRGTETCVVAAGMATRLKMASLLGDGRSADAVERAFFNGAAAAVSRDFKRHVYFQMPNHLGLEHEAEQCSSHARDTTTRYLEKHWPLCCTASLNRMIPNYVQGMWMRTADEGVATVLYGPSSYETELGAGAVAFTEKTDYPFSEQVCICIDRAPGAEFPLKVRVPAWCDRPELAVNGNPVSPIVKSGFAVLRRAWKQGDRIEMRFPMSPEVQTWKDMNEFGRTRMSVSCGPLLFAAPIPSKDDNTPLSDPHEPVLPSALAGKDVAMTRDPMPKFWDWPADAPVKLKLADADGNPLVLVPYGCAKMRVSAFPVIGDADGQRKPVGAPRNQGKVPILNDAMRDFLSRPRWERMGLLLDPEFRAAAKKAGSEPKPYDLRVWAEPSDGTLELNQTDGDDRRVVCVKTGLARIDNLKVAARYEWKAFAAGRQKAEGSFETEDGVPRICRMDGVGNVRDFGGGVTEDGRRVKQGIVYRSATFNHTADTPKDNRAKWRKGPSKLSESAREEVRTTFRIRTDLDLRTEDECYGMTGSPIGDDVKWVRIRSSNYASMKEPAAKKAFAADFRLISDVRNHPLVFHCGGGADRTGSLAWILGGILGMSVDDLYKDWELTVFDYDKLKFNHWNFIGALTRMLDECYPNRSVQGQCVAYANDCGITDGEIARFRAVMLEEK